MMPFWIGNLNCILKNRVLHFVFLLGVFDMPSAGLASYFESTSPQIQMKSQVTKALEEYFVSSQRRVEKIEITNMTHLGDREYLVQANVQAQAAFGPEIIRYHCGVFLKQVETLSTVDWTITTLGCEASLF